MFIKKTLFIIILSISNLFVCFGQPRYSIDIEPPKNRRIPISYLISQSSEKIKESKRIRKKHRIERKTSKKIIKHTYSIQTKKVRKRMRKSRKKAEIFNRGKLPLSVKLKKKLKWMN